MAGVSGNLSRICRPDRPQWRNYQNGDRRELRRVQWEYARATAQGLLRPFQLDGYNGDLALFGETVAEGTYDYIDISIASGMPAQEKFAAAPDKLNGGVTQPAPSEQTTTAQPAPTPPRQKSPT